MVTGAGMVMNFERWRWKLWQLVMGHDWLERTVTEDEW